MLIKPTLEKILPYAENRYVLAMFVSRRSHQLVNGARPTVNTDTTNFVSLACEEIVDGSVVYRHGEYQPEVPERPEIIAQREAARREAEQKQYEEMIEEQRTPGLIRKQSRTREIETFEKDGFTESEASMIAQSFFNLIKKTEQTEKGETSFEEIASGVLEGKDEANAEQQ